MLVAANRRPLRSVRSAFTLLEVLVVVAILVILASVAGVFVFGYLEDAKVDTARQQIQQLENAAKSYAAKHGGDLPPSLEYLVLPTDQGQPLLDGGEAALMDPWGGRYIYEQAQDANGYPDAVVYTTAPNGTQVVSNKRKAGR
jgi:general secretion pathway protein G